jgi:hypothetical protein
MPDVRSDNPWSPIKPPICPDCDVPMRLESGWPDTLHTNLRHMIFICDCGRTSDQMVADPE